MTMTTQTAHTPDRKSDPNVTDLKLRPVGQATRMPAAHAGDDPMRQHLHDLERPQNARWVLRTIMLALIVLVAWAAVGIPLAWGVYRTGLSVAKFFS